MDLPAGRAAAREGAGHTSGRSERCGHVLWTLLRVADPRSAEAESSRIVPGRG